MRANAAFCLLPGGLLNVDSALTLISFSRRDDADDFFAIISILPIHVDHQQQRPLRSTDRMPALFAVDDAILAKDYVGIVENQCRTGEREAVLPLIGGVLLLAPLKSHRYTYCITLRHPHSNR